MKQPWNWTITRLLKGRLVDAEGKYIGCYTRRSISEAFNILVKRHKMKIPPATALSEVRKATENMARRKFPELR